MHDDFRGLCEQVRLHDFATLFIGQQIRMVPIFVEHTNHAVGCGGVHAPDTTWACRWQQPFTLEQNRPELAEQAQHDPFGWGRVNQPVF